MTSEKIINDEDDIPLVEIEQPRKTLWRKVMNIIKHITVEPLGVVTILVFFMYNLMSKQYIYEYVARSYGFNTSTQSSACENSSTREDKVSAESSQWVLYLNIAGFAPSLFTVVIIGSWGDSVGRRLPCSLGFFGYLIMVINFLVVLCFDLPISYLFIGKIVSAICGDISIILGSVFAYLADKSTKENRTLKVAIGECCIGIGGIIGSLLSGFWVEKQGFIPPLIFMIAILIAALLYIKFIVVESIAVDPISIAAKFRLLFSMKPFIGIKKIFIDFDHFLKICGGVFCFFVGILVINGFNDVMVLYELSPPFCWGSLLIGYASALKLFSLVFSTIVIHSINKYVSDYYLAIIGMLSSISCLLFYAFTSLGWMLFLGLVTGWLSSMSSTVFRSVTSKLVTEDGQGSIFALLALGESLAGLVASFIVNPIYSATVAWFSGFVFLVMASFQLILIVFFSYFYFKIKGDIYRD